MSFYTVEHQTMTMMPMQENVQSLIREPDGALLAISPISMATTTSFLYAKGIIWL
jgi:hypothetical protein